MKYLLCLLLAVAACNGGGGDGSDEGPPPPPTTTIETPRPQDYIQWTCHESKPNCQDRFHWSNRVDEAYTIWRGERDLESLLDNPIYIEQYTDLTEIELLLIVGKMRKANAEGDRLIFRIETEMHRDFDPDPLGDWHRSQVRKNVANEMIQVLTEQSNIYYSIAYQFPDVPGCDSIACKIEKDVL